MTRLRHILALLLTVLALLVLAGGSVIEVSTLMGIGLHDDYPGARYEAGAVSLVIIWPPFVLATSLCGSLALVLAKQKILIPLLLGAAITISLISVYSSISPVIDLPMHGPIALLVILLFIALNAGAVSIAYMLVRDTRVALREVGGRVDAPYPGQAQE